MLHEMAQTATFLAIVCTQIADLLMCRCRRDSLVSRGCTNWQLNSAIVSQVKRPPPPHTHTNTHSASVRV